MKPVILVYTKDEDKRRYKKFNDFTVASFWIGMEYGSPEGQGNVKLVKIDVYEPEAVDGRDALSTFVGVLLERGIDHDLRFLHEPPPVDVVQPTPGAKEALDDRLKELDEMKLRGALREGEYEELRQAVMSKWSRAPVDGSPAR